MRPLLDDELPELDELDDPLDADDPPEDVDALLPLELPEELEPPRVYPCPFTARPCGCSVLLTITTGPV